MKTLCYGSLVLLLGAGTALAKTHPVPLDKNTPASKCLECHEDKTKGKSVHSAIATGCLSCHEVRSTKDVTRIKLATVTPVKLCLQCHADKDAAQIKGHVHAPNVRDCLTCHDPHTSKNNNVLVKAEAGEAKDNLCLQCHATGLNVGAKGSHHLALDSGCDTCHTIHKSGAKPDAEFRDHLTKAVPALCVDCHDPKDKDLVKAHKEQPIQGDCLECHDPHQSNAPKLMRAFLHNPFESGDCDTCHKPPKDGKVVLTFDSTREVCVMCHEEAKHNIDTAKFGHEGAKGDCTACHSPHGGNNPGFIQPDPVAACLGCHSETADQLKKAHVHQPAGEQSCAICHEPHGGNNPKLLRTASVNELCLECHGPDSDPKPVKNEHLVAIFGGKVKLPEDYFKKVAILPLKYGIGHPTEQHPVANVTNLQTKAVTQMSCLSCHQAHSSKQPGLLVKDQANNMDFCRTCHADGLNLKQTTTGTK